VDDDDVAVESIVRSFERHALPCNLFWAEDGLMALRILRNEVPDKRVPEPRVVLLDLNMPRMNGFEFLQALRAEPQLQSTVVFVLTTSGSDADRLRAYQEHISGYMVKTAVGPQFSKLVRLLADYQVSVAFPPE
jgi:CheY-like chemotaxis protein